MMKACRELNMGARNLSWPTLGFSTGVACVNEDNCSVRA
jgi:hypothetical protein